MSVSKKCVLSLVYSLLLLLTLPLVAVAQEDDSRDRLDRRRPGDNRRRRSEDVSLLLISSGDVQRELDITPAQGELLEAIGEDLSAQRVGGWSRRGSRISIEDRLYRAELPGRLFQVVLDEEQSKRLVQIGFQFKGAFAIDDEQFAKAVSLDDEQLASLRKARSKQPDLTHSRLKELLGNSKAEKWKTQMGESFDFRGPLRRLRSAYLNSYDAQRRSGRSRRPPSDQ